jgi:hypothetical protein
VKRGQHFAQAYEIKVRWYGEHVEKHKENLRNLIGTYWEFKRNLVGNTLGMRETWKKILPPTNLKPKKARHIEYMLGPSHWLHENSLQKGVCHHFWRGVKYPLQRTPYLPIGEGRSNDPEATPFLLHGCIILRKNRRDWSFLWETWRRLFWVEGILGKENTF